MHRTTHWSSLLLGWTLGALILLSVPTAADAQDPKDEPWWFAADAAFVTPLNDPYTDAFGVGLAGHAAVYRGLIPHVQLGLRVGGGGLFEEDEVNAGALGFGTLLATVRLRPMPSMAPDRRATGLYGEVGAGGAILDTEVRPGFAAALGYNFPVGPVAVGPVVRFTHIIETEERFGGGDDFLMLQFGVEVAFGDRVDTGQPMQAETATTGDRDGDGYPDDEDQCPDEAETWNGVDDQDGCPDEGSAMLEGESFSFQERVFFDFDSAELRPEGQAILRQLATRHQNEGDEWTKLVVSGHADKRGADWYNEELSRERARAVETFLTEQGVPADKMEVRAFGESDPLVEDANTEREYQLNRRVHFEIQR